MKRICWQLILAPTLLCLYLTCVCQGNQNPSFASGYVQTYGNAAGSKNKVATRWFYNEYGQLITDSLQTLDSLAYLVPHTTVHYYYNDDSVIGIRNDRGQVAIKLNTNGLPVFTSDPQNRTFYAYYNNEGELTNVDEQNWNIGRVRFIDSVVYKKGNIISYCEPWYSDTAKVCFTLKYYTGRKALNVYGSKKPFALRATRIFGTMIDVQALSTDLLRSVTSTSVTSGRRLKQLSFRYVFDKKGRAIKMNRILQDPYVGKHESEFVFTYPH